MVQIVSDDTEIPSDLVWEHPRTLRQAQAEFIGVLQKDLSDANTRITRLKTILEEAKEMADEVHDQGTDVALLMQFLKDNLDTEKKYDIDRAKVVELK